MNIIGYRNQHNQHNYDLSRTWSISFINMLKISEPIIEHCGTPLMISH